MARLPLRCSGRYIERRSPPCYGYFIMANHSRLATVTWPVTNPVITSQFGRRAAPVPGASALHNGIDFRAPVGTPIHATQDGVVDTVGSEAGSGNFILIGHTDGSMSGYAHTAPRVGLRRGLSVRAREQIGTSDGSGRISGPHLHYTYRPGTLSRPATRRTPAVDPLATQFKGMTP